MEALFEKKLGTRKTIAKELMRLHVKLEDDVDYYKTFGCFEEIKKVRCYQKALRQSIEHLENLIAKEQMMS